MFDPNKLKVGDVFYSINERNGAFHRKKIHQEIDGVDWFRYDRPLRTYELVINEVLGIIRKEIEGKWDNYDIESGGLQPEFYIRYQDETHMRQQVTSFYGDDDKYFIDKEEALEYIKTLEEKVRELDKT